MTHLSAKDGFDVLWILCPLATMLIGFGGGILLTRVGFAFGFRDHLEKHSPARKPDLNCIFCREERGVIIAAQMEKPHQSIVLGKATIPCSCPECQKHIQKKKAVQQ